MERIDFSNINHSDKKKRECYPQIEEFVNNNVCLNGKVVVLYGLRRTVTNLTVCQIFTQ